MKISKLEDSAKPGLAWIFRMAVRDAKASKGKLMLFMASIILGIAAVVSIQSFSSNLKDTIGLQSKALMGADYIIDSDDLPNQRVIGIMDSLGGSRSEEIQFTSMAAFPRSRATRLVQVRGIKGNFPLFGELETLPVSAAREYQETGTALVDATLMLQLGITAGDIIKIGNVQLPVQGAIKSVPGSTSVFSSIAPPVIIPHRFIEETGLVQVGSRIGYKYYFQADPALDLDKLDKTVDPILDANNADLDTHTSTSERLGRRYENFGKFLNLVAFIALLLGCVGIASAIHIYIKEKLRPVAILKCLGATRKQTFLIYLTQIALIGLTGGILGSLLGVLLQQLFPFLLDDIIPVTVEIGLDFKVIFIGIILGIVMSVLFGLYPLTGTLYVPALHTLRFTAHESSRSGKAGLLVLGSIFIFILFFAYWLLENWMYSISFVLGIIITFAFLAGVANIFMKMIRRFFPENWGFIARQSLLNLFRPQNQTLILVLAIGTGTFLISTLYFTKDLLLAQASLDEQAGSPNMILLDVQTEQQEEVAQIIKAEGLPMLENIPIVTMRVHGLKGRSVNEIRKDTTSGINNWILQHEFRTTYRDTLISSETILEGQWTGHNLETGIVPISVSDNFAKDAEVGIGDKVVFNVQGLLLNTVVSSIRKVDWSRMQLNFSVLFPAGVLEEAPQFRILTTRVSNESSSAELQQKIVASFPTVTIIDLRQVLQLLEQILTKISWLINFMAFFSIFTGIIVLIGAVRTSKFQRIRESVLLRTLGAKSRQILKILALEYFYLGSIGALSGILLSLISSQLLGYFVFETSFIPSWMPFTILLPGIILLVMSIGLANSLGVIKSPPLVVLRKELS